VGAPKTSFSWAFFVASFNFSLIAGSLIVSKKNNFDFKWNSKFTLNYLNIMRGYIIIASSN